MAAKGSGACSAIVGVSTGSVYRAIEPLLWTFAAGLLLLFLLSYDASTHAAHTRTEAGWAKDVAAENVEYCTKWGMPPGSSKHRSCIRDLVAIRARAEQRLRDTAILAIPP